jgi:hypothetical protein
VLERPHLEPDLVAEPHEHEDLVGAVRVAVDEARPSRISLSASSWQVLARRDVVLVLLPEPAPLLLPGRLVVARRDERGADRLLDAHAALRIAIARGIAPVGLLRVLAERELDPSGAPAKRSSDAGRPHFQRSTAFCPPMEFAEPCSAFTVVVPPASWR